MAIEQFLIRLNTLFTAKKAAKTGMVNDLWEMLIHLSSVRPHQCAVTKT